MSKHISGTQPRPRCIRCGKPYGFRYTQDETIQCDAETEPVWPQTNAFIVRVRSWTHGTGTTRHVRDLWDGVTWRGGNAPFCTNRCAYAMACDGAELAQAARKLSEQLAQSGLAGSWRSMAAVRALLERFPPARG